MCKLLLIDGLDITLQGDFPDDFSVEIVEINQKGAKHFQNDESAFCYFDLHAKQFGRISLLPESLFLFGSFVKSE